MGSGQSRHSVHMKSVKAKQFGDAIVCDGVNKKCIHKCLIRTNPMSKNNIKSTKSRLHLVSVFMLSHKEHEGET